MARLLSLSEAVNALHSGDMIWVEYRDAKYREPVVAAIMIPNLGYWMDQNDDIIEPSELDEDIGDGPYNVKFRLWDTRPEYTQRKVMKWNE